MNPTEHKKRSGRAALRYLAGCALLSVLFVSCTEQAEPDSKSEKERARVSESTIASRKETGDTAFKANITTEMSDKVLSILQDKNDNYWFGTQSSGVYRYTGKTLIRFTVSDGLTDNQVLDIQEDRSGVIWFSTGRYGVCRFDGKVISPVQNESASQKNTKPETPWKTEPGDLWFDAGGGAYRYYRDTLSYLPLPKAELDARYAQNAASKASAYGVYSNLKDRSGRLWFGTQAMGVCCFDGTSFKWLTDKGLRGPAVLAVFEDRNGDLWFGNNGRGLFRYDGKTLINFTEEKDLANPEFIKSGMSGPGTLARVLAINEDNRGNLWIGTCDAGAWCYDGKNLTNYTSKDGMPDSAIETIYKDKKGDLWFGTNGAGVYKFNGFVFTKFHFVTSQ